MSSFVCTYRRSLGIVLVLAGGVFCTHVPSRGADDGEKNKATAAAEPMVLPVKDGETADDCKEDLSEAVAKPTTSPAKNDKKAEDSMKKALQDAQIAYEKEQQEMKKRLEEDPLWQPSHAQVAVIKPNAGQIESFCLSKDGNLLVCCGGSQASFFGISLGKADAARGAVLTLSAEGKKIASWTLPLNPQAICLGGDVIYVAGAGRLVKLDSSGKVLLQADAPNLAELPPLPEVKKTTQEEGPAAEAAQQAKQKKIAELRRSADQAMKDYMKAAREAQKDLKSDDEVSRQAYQEKIQALLEKLQSVQAELQEASTTPEQRVKQAEMQRERMSTITGMAATDRDLFIACASAKGYGYSVWRLDRDFGNAKKIVENLAGCCGQMDIQARGGDLWVAHNARHKVERYSREGKKLSAFGKTDRTNADGFGGCCEPKNLRFGPGDIVFAAESGPPTCVKRFTAAGKFVGVAVIAPWNSGCVRVTTEYDAKQDRFFVLHSDEQSIHVFAKQAAKAAASASFKSGESSLPAEER